MFVFTDDGRSGASSLDFADKMIHFGTACYISDVTFVTLI